MSRAPDQLRPLSIERDFPAAAPGSVMIATGKTRILCTASWSTNLPGWLKDEPKGWITAEYNMLPGSTTPRKRRKADGRSTEIQRMIARVLRSTVDLKKMKGLFIECDCDVIYADGGTRTAAITGAFVAMADAISNALVSSEILTENPILGPVAAVSVGIVDGRPVLDLDYDLDFRAAVDLNVAINHKGDFIEIQGTGEENSFSRDELNQMLDLASAGIKQLIAAQETALQKTINA